MRRYVSGPLIAALTLTPKMTVNDRLRAGSYGPTIRCGRIVLADLELVEAFHGTTFDAGQVALAVDGKDDRLFLIPDKEEIDGSTVGAHCN